MAVFLNLLCQFDANIITGRWSLVTGDWYLYISYLYNSHLSLIMKYRSILLLIFIFFSISLNAQWEWLNPLPQGNRLNDVCITPSGKVIAVGYSATIIRTDDNGLSWDVENIGNDPYSSYQSVYFTDEDNGWIAGYRYHGSGSYRNYVLRTGDGGQTWDTSFYTIQDMQLRDIFFLDSMKGWAVGTDGFMVSTIDGGVSWRSHKAITNNRLNAVSFANSLLGLAVGENGTILYTGNGGLRWEIIPVDHPVDFYEICFVDDNIIYICGSGGTVLFSNNGMSWISCNIGNNMGVNDVYFKTKDTGWVCGTGSYIYRTTDGGNSWDKKYINSTGNFFYFIAFCNLENEFWMIGRYVTIQYSQDWGESWFFMNPGPRSSFRSMSFVNENVGWVIENNQFLSKSTDGGKQWDIKYMATASLRDLFCLDENNFYACTRNTVLISNDGGVNWTTYNFSNDSYFEAIFFNDPMHGWIVGGLNDTIYFTTDGGQSWNASVANNYWNSNDVFFIDNLNGWITGSRILHTCDGGLSWEEQYQDDLTEAIYFTDKNKGWAIEHAGNILYTSDGGQNWEIQQSNAGYMFDMSFADSLTGWILGHEGKIWHTTDGGDHWIKTIFPTRNYFKSIYAFDQDNVWACGGDGNIIKYSSTKQTIHLSDNREVKDKGEIIVFPNPLSHSTNIKLSLCKPSMVHIQIFNSNGSIVQSYSQYCETGSQSYQWNAIHHAPGIYFYRIQTEGKTHTGKMIKL